MENGGKVKYFSLENMNQSRVLIEDIEKESSTGVCPTPDGDDNNST
jgi:hypothetical protein